MRAEVGDRLHVHGRVVGRSDQTWEIIWVHGPDGYRRISFVEVTGMRCLCFLGTGSSVDCCSTMSPRDFNRLALFVPTIRSIAGELSSTPNRPNCL
jgi:hypothetical protein